MKTDKKKRVLTICTVAGTYQPVYHGYEHGPFLIHRSVRKRGWTLTHIKTADAVVMRLPNLRVAHWAANEFLRLFPRWDACTRHFDLLHELRKEATGREFYAIARFIHDLQQGIKSGTLGIVPIPES